MKNQSVVQSEQHKIEELKKELEKAKIQAEDHLNGWKRAKADYINFKRETEKKQKEMAEFVTAGVVLELFPLIDQFKQAFRHLPKDLEKSEWILGIKHIQNNLNKILSDFDIKEIPTAGEKFNPEFHEAVVEVESDQEKGTIMEEVKTGFKINDRVIQPAKVKISKGKSLDHKTPKSLSGLEQGGGDLKNEIN